MRDSSNDLEYRALAVLLAAPQETNFLCKDDFLVFPIRKLIDLHGLPLQIDSAIEVAQQTPYSEGTLLEALGGAEALRTLHFTGQHEAKPSDLALLLRNRSALRHGRQVLEASLLETTPNAVEWIDRVTQKLKRIDAYSFDPTAGFLDDAAQAHQRDVDWQLAHPGAFYGIPLGIEALDEETHGLRFGDIFLVLGATNEGKTMLLMHIALHNMVTSSSYLGDEKGRGVFYSLEMTREEFIQKAAQWCSGVNYYQAISPQATAQERTDYITCVRRLGKQRTLKVVEGIEVRTKHQLMNHIRSQAREGTKLFYIDGIGLVQPNPGERSSDQWRDLQELAYDLRLLALELNIILFQAGQNTLRDSAGRYGRPSMAQIMGSQGIAQAASAIVHVWQPYRHVPPGLKEDWDRVMVLVGDKGRRFRLHGDYLVHFDGRTGQFDALRPEQVALYRQALYDLEHAEKPKEKYRSKP